MADIVLQSNHIAQMNTNTTEDSDSSTDDVFIELAEAWSFVKKWYNFRIRNENENDASFSRVKFTRSKSKGSSQKLKSSEPRSSVFYFQDLPVSCNFCATVYLSFTSKVTLLCIKRLSKVRHQKCSIFDTDITVLGNARSLFRSRIRAFRGLEGGGNSSELFYIVIFLKRRIQHILNILQELKTETGASKLTCHVFYLRQF